MSHSQSLPEEQTQAAVSDNEQLSGSHLKLQGPRLELSSLRLLMECTPGQTAAAVQTARNTGTTALFYTWELQSQSNREGPQRFLLSDQKGVILPGASRDFRCQESYAFCTAHMYMQQILSWHRLLLPDKHRAGAGLCHAKSNSPAASADCWLSPCLQLPVCAWRRAGHVRLTVAAAHSAPPRTPASAGHCQGGGSGGGHP